MSLQIDQITQIDTIQIVDASGNLAVLKPASTAAAAADTSLVTALSPNSPLPAGTNLLGSVSQSNGPWTINLTQVSGSALSLGQTTMANSLPVTFASNQSALPVSQSGTWTVQPGNTANTTPWLVTVSTALPAGSNNIGSVNQGTSPWVVSGTVAVTQSTSPWTVQDNASNTSATTAVARGLQIMGVFNTTPATLINGQAGFLQLDSAENLLVNLKTAIPTGANTIGAVTQASGPWTVNLTQVGSSNIVTGTGASGAGIPRVTVSNDSNVLVTQSTSPWITQDGADGPVTPGAVASKSILAGGQYNSALPSPTNTQQVALQVDYKGRLITAPSSYSYFHPIYTTRVQFNTGATSSTSTTLTVTLPSPTTAGNLIVITAASATQTLTASDSASQTYSTATTETSGNNHAYVFYKANTAGGVTSVTITAALAASINIIVAEYANILALTPLDKTSTNTNSATTTWTSNATTTTAQANELLIGAATAILHASTTFTAGPNWNAVGTIADAVGGVNLVTFLEEQYVAAVGAYAATGTTSASDTELAAIATFEISSYPTGFTIPNNATVIKSGPGTLAGLTISTAGTGSAKVTFYDNTTNSGTIIAVVSLTSTGSFSYNAHFTNGLTMVVNSITADFTVTYD